MEGLLPSSQDTIAALSSAKGRSAVAVIRMSGPDVGKVLRRALKNANCLTVPRRVKKDILLDQQGMPLDEVLAVFFPAPASYTGQDMAEIHCHGGQVVVEKALDVLFSVGARPARAGEFTRRAFENGKLDLTRAEAVMQLIDAQTAEQVMAAAAALVGKVAQELRDFIEQSREILAYFDAAIDFPEEGDFERPQKQLEKLLEKISILEKRLRLEVSSDFEIVICGRQNVGKSSLLNAMVGRTVALVTEYAGTTRDPIPARVRLCGCAVELVDTAGISEGESQSPIDRLSQEISRRKIEESSLSLWVCEIAAPQTPPTWCREPILVVNKADLMNEENEAFVTRWVHEKGAMLVSAKTGKGISELFGEIEKRIESRLGPKDGVPVSLRQKKEIEKAKNALEKALVLSSGNELELAAEEMRAALDALGQLTGESVSTDVLDIIFSRFCIGK